MTPPLEIPARSMILSLLLLMAAVSSTPAHALNVGYACQADANTVFDVVTETALDMHRWRSIRVMDRHRTIRAVVRNWRNSAVPVWIQVRATPLGESEARSEIHVMWEQAMEPLNYPDLIPFMDLFTERQGASGLHCSSIGTDIGL